MNNNLTYTEINQIIQTQTPSQIINLLTENQWLLTYIFKNLQSTKIYNQDMNLLHIICKRDRLDVLQTLFEFETNFSIQIKLDVENKCGWTPLYFACKHGHLDVVKFLLEHNPELITHKSKKGNPLILACQSNNLELVKYLTTFKEVDINHIDEEGICAVYMACYIGNEKIVKYLIEEKKAKTDFVTPMNEGNLLHAACTFEFENLINYFLELGFKLTDLDSDENTPLHLFAAATNNPEFLENLIKKGGDLWAKNNEGLNVIDYADKWENLFIVEYLREKYLQPEQRSVFQYCVIF